MSNVTVPSWSAELEREVLMVPTGRPDPKTGREKVVRVVKTTIFLSRGALGLAFTVGRGAKGQPVITDRREQATGAAPLTLAGPCPGEQYTKSGPVRKLTATAWVAEVARLIGEPRAREIVAQL